MGNALNYATKVASLEDNAAADLSAAEIKTLYESNIWTNEFSDAEQTKIANLDDGTYTAPNLSNGWVNYSTTYQQAGYRKDESGTVHIRGLIKSGTVNASTFTLPVGYRPAYNHIFPTDANSIIERLDVWSNGAVYAYTASNAWFSIECSFKAEQ